MSCVNNVLNISFLHLRSTSSYIVGVKRYPWLCFTLLFSALYSSRISCLTIWYYNPPNYIISDFSLFSCWYLSLNMWCISENRSISSVCFLIQRKKNWTWCSRVNTLSIKWRQFLVSPVLFFINAIFFVCLLIKHLLSSAHKNILVHPIKRSGVIMRCKLMRPWTRCLAV